MTFHQIKMAVYATFLTNYYGFKLKKETDSKAKKQLRIAYAEQLLAKLNLEIKVVNPEVLPADGQFLLLCNHRTIIDPVIVEIVTKNSTIFGHWVSKKELYNSFFFGVFVRNGGSILLNRDSKQMSGFFTDIKKCVKNGNSIYMFPEGTRNKTDSTVIPFHGGAQLIAIKNHLPILPIFIKGKVDNILIAAIKNANEKQVIEVEIGTVIDSKDRSVPLEEAYKAQFNII